MNKPFNCQIELVRGCNRKCDFCAIHTVPKKIKFMELDTLINTLRGLKEFGAIRIEFAMRGEPLIHPDFLDMITMTRSICQEAQITLTTNGIKLTKEKAYQFFIRGGNIIVVDCYDDNFNNVVEKLDGLPYINFYKENFSPWNRHPLSTKKIVLIEDLANVNGKKAQRQVLNQAGNVNFDLVKKYGVTPLEKPLNKKCVHPFREVSVFWNGNVSMCCRDWGEEQILYNVNDRLISNEWIDNELLNDVRSCLYNKHRNFSICKRCDFNGGFRIGFLPVLPLKNKSDLIDLSNKINKRSTNKITK